MLYLYSYHSFSQTIVLLFTELMVLPLSLVSLVNLFFGWINLLHKHVLVYCFKCPLFFSMAKKNSFEYETEAYTSFLFCI